MDFIEFFGLPGSGKSYLTAEIKKKKRLFETNFLIIFFRTKTISSILYKLSTFLLGLPSIFFSRIFYKIIYFFIIFYRPIKTRYFSFRTISIVFNFLYLVALIKLSEATKKNKILVDQGFFQIFSTLIYEMKCINKKKYNSMIKEWLSIIYSLNLHHKVIKLNIPKQTIEKRIKERKGDSILDKPDYKKYLNYYSKIFEVIAKDLKKESSINGRIEIFAFSSNESEVLNLISAFEK